MQKLQLYVTRNESWDDKVQNQSKLTFLKNVPLPYKLCNKKRTISKKIDTDLNTLDTQRKSGYY